MLREEVVWLQLGVCRRPEALVPLLGFDVCLPTKASTSESSGAPELDRTVCSDTQRPDPWLVCEGQSSDGG